MTVLTGHALLDSATDSQPFRVLVLSLPGAPMTGRSGSTSLLPPVTKGSTRSWAPPCRRDQPYSASSTGDGGLARAPSSGQLVLQAHNERLGACAIEFASCTREGVQEGLAGA